MQIGDLYTLLASTGLPVTYNHWKEAHEPPYIVYLATGSDNEGADNKVCNKAINYDIELYTDKKDTETEATLEILLDENKIFWDKVETYIDGEKLYQVVYSIQLLD